MSTTITTPFAPHCSHAAYEGRSINREVLYLIRREIEAFEKEHGKIELPEEAEE